MLLIPHYTTEFRGQSQNRWYKTYKTLSAAMLLNLLASGIHFLLHVCVSLFTGNPGSVIVPQYSSNKITVFVWGKNTILKFLRNTK